MYVLQLCFGLEGYFVWPQLKFKKLPISIQFLHKMKTYLSNRCFIWIFSFNTFPKR